ncbi:AAA family ATPase [Candidatus Woesearchaeota archaeon]|jgi:KaiC/GvpD/RAD55 family RecA-like ATPase|nr:AAA family ATPase [Candidatus Woesearchaeota archaeon]MBT6044862.1 AAA family ATPase [Candidatus Woesearchaeota archaeon]
MVGEERVSTGVPNLDKLIGGGFKQGSVNIVAGKPGSGKSIFAMQFLVDGLKRGEGCIYISFEERKKKVFEDFREFGWDLEQYERTGLLKFLENTPEQIRRVVADGGGTLEVIATQIGAKRVVIDSISSFSMLFQNDSNKRGASLALFEIISKWGCTTLLTSNAENEDGIDLDFEVDGVIFLHHQMIKNSRERSLEVIKMRGTDIPNKIMKMDLDKKGITINPSKAVSL